MIEQPMSDDEKRKILCRDLPVGATWRYSGERRSIAGKKGKCVFVGGLTDIGCWMDEEGFRKGYSDCCTTDIHLPPASLLAPEKPLPAPAAPVPSKLHGPMPTGTMPATGAKLAWDALAEEKPATPVPTEPLPCPWCGGKPEIVHQTNGKCVVQCDNGTSCRATALVWAHTDDGAIAIWNRRTPDPTLAADLLTLRDENARLAKEADKMGRRISELHGYANEYCAQRDAALARVVNLETEINHAITLIDPDSRRDTIEARELLIRTRGTAPAGVPAAAPATAGVRVFRNSVATFACNTGHQHVLRLDPDGWRLAGAPNRAEAYRVHYGSETELSPAEVAALLAAHPLPPATTPAAPQAQWVEAFPAKPTQQPRAGGAWVKVGVAT